MEGRRQAFVSLRRFRSAWYLNSGTDLRIGLIEVLKTIQARKFEAGDKGRERPLAQASTYSQRK
jgi:hypothetical protein